jgi:hypothetical protein
VQVVVRAATADDGAAVVRFLDAAYRGGYSPTFDRDGPLQPNDLWWAQSEKDVSVIEVNRRPAGLLVVGRHAGQWLVEELLLPGAGDHAPRSHDALVQRLTAHLTLLFQRGRQTALLVRAAEENAFALALTHALRATLTNALLVYRYHGTKRPAAHAPGGYQIRRAAPADARALGRLAREVTPDRGRAEEIERALGSKTVRAYAALKEEVVVGFAVAETRAGRGDWMVGVRDSHRRQGVGRALAASVLAGLHGREGRERSPFATAWSLDPTPGAFLRALGFTVERTYLYLEHPL